MLLHTDILKRLRQSPRSLADLQADAQVSLPTLRKAVQDLTESHWIRIVGQAEANGGRPPNIYGLDTSYYVIIGVHLQLPGLHMITTNLNGDVLHEKRIIYETSSLPNDVLAAITDYVIEVRAAMPTRVVLGVGVASPGFIDPPSGDILMIGRVPGWENFPVCSRLRSLVNLPVRIANDIDCMALAEFQGSGISTDQDLIYLGFDEGVKASLFLNGTIYKGALGNAGLIAGALLRMPSDESLDDPDAVLSIHRVNDLFDQRLSKEKQPTQAAYAAISSIDDPRRRFERILTFANGQYPLCLAVTSLMNQMIAAAVANLVLILQPHVFVLGGMLSVMPPSVFASLNSRIRNHLPPMISNNLTIRLGVSTSSNTAASGAVLHFLEHYLIEAQEDLLDLSQMNQVFRAT